MFSEHAYHMLGEHRVALLVGSSAVCGLLAVLAHQWYARKSLRDAWNSAGEGVVVLHTLPRGRRCPSISTYALKLETYLRMHDIPYQVDFSTPTGTKGKLPWITLNGVDVADTELIIRHLEATLGVARDPHLSREQKAQSTMLRVMLEEHFNWGRLSWRFLEDDLKGLREVQSFPLHYVVGLKLMKRRIKTSLQLQGIGRHTTAELHSFMREDMEALSVQLGSSPFLLGDEPSSVDCSAFGTLCQIAYNMPGSPYLAWLREDFPNLAAYTLRMKERFWPDWSQHLSCCV